MPPPCSGTQTGQQLSYDATGRLTTWQNQPTPTSAVSYLYDGEGTRVALQTTNGVGPATSTTAYIGDVEEVQTAGSTTTATTYYYAGSERIAEAVNGVFSYLGSDRLGSPVVNLSTSGITTATQLYAPYGANRYSSGTMPTDKGGTYHWDDQWDPENVGRLLKHNLDDPHGSMPHLQIHPRGSTVIRIFFS